MHEKVMHEVVDYLFRPTSRSFIAGAFCCSFMMAARQDFFGLERSVESLRLHWMSTPWWIWPPLILVCIGAQAQASTSAQRKLP